jgi:hypothetical protein
VLIDVADMDYDDVLADTLSASRRGVAFSHRPHESTHAFALDGVPGAEPLD